MDKFIENKRTRKQIKENGKKKKKNIKEDNCQVKFFKQKQLLLLYFVRFSSYCAILRTVYILFLTVRCDFLFFSTFTLLKIDFVVASYSRGPSPSRRIDTQRTIGRRIRSSERRSFLLFLLSVLLYFVLFVRDRFFKRLLNSR